MAKNYLRAKTEFSMDARTLMTPASKCSNNFISLFLSFFYFYLKTMLVLQISQNIQEINSKT